MAKETAIVLTNGSVESAVAAAVAVQRYRPVLLHVDTAPADPPTRRRQAVEAQGQHFRAFREHALALPLPTLAEQEGMATDPRAVEPVTHALQRLTPFIGLAVHLAAAYGSAAIYTGLRIGPRVDDLARATEYFQIWDEMVQLALGRPNLSVQSPLLELELWQAVDLGCQVNAPLDRTWSCVDEHADPCNACRGCRSRDAAFMQAAKPDPLKLARAK